MKIWVLALACLAETAAYAPVLSGLNPHGTRPLRCLRPAPSGRCALRMGLFDAFKNALANEDLGTPPPDGLSQDPWLSGMRKPIFVNFVMERVN